MGRGPEPETYGFLNEQAEAQMEYNSDRDAERLETVVKLAHAPSETREALIAESRKRSERCLCQRKASELPPDYPELKIGVLNMVTTRIRRVRQAHDCYSEGCLSRKSIPVETSIHMAICFR